MTQEAESTAPATAQDVSPERILKACPIVLRRTGGTLEFLAFEHPQAGLQIVKGGVDSGEEPYQAALRELQEESGIEVRGRSRNMGKSDGIEQGERWYFFLCPIPPMPDTWNHHTADDGGQDFRFFWQGFDAFFTEEWHPQFIRAIRHIQNKLESISQDQLNQYVNTHDSNLAETIENMLRQEDNRGSIDPTAIARQIAGKDEKEWRKQMKPIRAEAIRLARQGRATILRKGKVVDPGDFKGIYRIGPPAEDTQ